MRLITAKEVSEVIKVKKSTIYLWAASGLIPAIRLNGTVRFDIDEIENWIKERRIKLENDRVEKILNSLKAKDIDIDRIVKKTIASVKASAYNSTIKGKPDEAGRKGGPNGSF